MGFAVRYIVEEVATAVQFYRDNFEFEVEMDASPAFASLSRDGMRLLLNAPGAGGAGIAGGTPQPGGWNRFQLEVDDLAALTEELRSRGVTFRGEVVQGRGGSQVLVEDPSGNPIELFQAAD